MDHGSFATNCQRGLSLLEIIIALSIMAILAGTAVPSFQRMLARRLIEGRAIELRNDLVFARSEAVARNTPVRLSFKPMGNGACYVVHTGKSEDCRCSDAGPAVCTRSAQQIKTVTMPGSDAVRLQWGMSHNASYVAFDEVRGTATSYGSVTLSGPQADAIKLVVNSMGRARACAPSAAWSGYKPC